MFTGVASAVLQVGILGGYKCTVLCPIQLFSCSGLKHNVCNETGLNIKKKLIPDDDKRCCHCSCLNDDKDDDDDDDDHENDDNDDDDDDHVDDDVYEKNNRQTDQGHYCFRPQLLRHLYDN